jgi:hypothetical protein
MTTMTMRDNGNNDDVKSTSETGALLRSAAASAFEVASEAAYALHNTPPVKHQAQACYGPA